MLKVPLNSSRSINYLVEHCVNANLWGTISILSLSFRVSTQDRIIVSYGLELLMLWEFYGFFCVEIYSTVYIYKLVLYTVIICLYVLCTAFVSGEYLVKWQGLPYSECTQEDCDLIRRQFPDAVAEYSRRQKSTCLPTKNCRVDFSD